MARIIITGGAGFIGSHVVDRMLDKYDVVVMDNLSSGKREYINRKAVFIERDLLKDNIECYFKDVDMVFHLAANPDVKIGASDTSIHLQQNIVATHRVLEAMRKNEIKNIVFTSTSTVYGEAPIPTTEAYGPLLPISLYGASKLACEALISAYCFTFGMRSWIYRFANVVGVRSTHGVSYDFINKLKSDPNKLEILGDGYQNKSYIYISDCIEGMQTGLQSESRVNVFNIGTESQTNVRRIAEIVAKEMGLTPQLKFAGGSKGWQGDVPVMLLSIQKLKKMGWKPKYDSDEAVRKAIRDQLE